MAWSQLKFVIDSAEVDRVSAMLETFLAQAVTSENAGQDEFYEVAFPGTPDWDKVAVTGLFEDSVDLQPIVDFVHGQFSDQEVPTTISRLADQDWERVWLDSFKPTKVGDNLWVCPSWCEPIEPQAKNIILDPGLAFGTGTHPTTAMCLQWISQQNLSGKEVLDYGSGSGILAIAALLFGAESACAVDVDPLAVTAAQENAQRNGLDHLLTSVLPENLEGRKYPVVIANILADVIIELRDTLLLHLEDAGELVLTGILSSQAERVKLAFGENFQFEMKEQDQWCLLVARSF